MTKVVIAGGGTAGHVEPGLAVAQWLRDELGSSSSISFIGTAAGVEADLVPRAGFPLTMISKVVAPRRPNKNALLFPFLFARSVRQAQAAVKGADVLIGFGGYVSAPAYLAAKMSGVPIVAHEANARAGFANRLASSLGATIAITFDLARSTSKRWRSAVMTGLPVKAEIVALSKESTSQRAASRKIAAESFGLDPARPIVLVFGGSLGARQINEAISGFVASAGESVQILHALGNRQELPQSTRCYKAVPYIYDMAKAYAAADLIIARSGAVTCVEVALVQRYAIFVPLAIGNGEQRFNAASLAEQQAAEIVDNSKFTSGWLKENLADALQRAQAYMSASHSGQSLPASDAARRIGELALAAAAKDRK